MKKKKLAERIIETNSLWERTNKSVIADNVERYLYAKYPESQKSYKAKMEKMQEISGLKKDTVYAWVNRSREEAKVPFIKLCALAVDLGVDIEDMLIETNGGKHDDN